MPRPVRIALVALVVIAALVAWWVMSRPSATVMAPRAEGAAVQAVEVQASETARVDAPVANAPRENAEPAKAALAMPPPPALAAVAPAPAAAPEAAPRLIDEIEELDRRAREGDVAAACTVGAELLRCERARVMQPYTDNVEAQARALAQRGMQEAEMDRQIDAALQRQAANDEVLARCDGIDDAQWPAPARYFQIAAAAGHRPSMIQFLNAEHFRSDRLFRDPGLIDLYRANAPRYFMQLMQEGNLETLHRWGMSAAMPHDLLRSVLPPPYNDAGFAAAMQIEMLQARGIPPPNSPLRTPPTAQQQHEAQQLFQRQFANGGPAERRLNGLTASPQDLSSYGCDEAPGVQR